MCFPGKLFQYTLYHGKLPDEEYDSNGIPYGIQPDYERPFTDYRGKDKQYFLYMPSGLLPMQSCKTLFVAGDFPDKDSVEELLVSNGLSYLAERDQAFLVFYPVTENFAESEEAWEHEIQLLIELQTAAIDGYLFAGRNKCHCYYLSMLGLGIGGDLVHCTLARFSKYIGSAVTVGGSVTSEQFPKDHGDCNMNIWMINPPEAALEYWQSANGLKDVPWSENGETKICERSDNPAIQIRVTELKNEPDYAKVIPLYWDECFSNLVRVSAIGNGELFNPEKELNKYLPSIHTRDRSLGDNGGIEHDWVEFIPSAVREKRSDPTYKCPLLLVLHGGGSMFQMEMGVFQAHKLGEAEEFITVYANASEGRSWNSTLLPQRYDDVEYLMALVEYVKSNYPVDPEKVYITGFSNGSGMSHAMAALCPDLFAGLIAFNTRYRIGEALQRKACIVKERKDYRMPVFSTYGTLDAEYPLLNGCAQSTQMNFWRWYNNIPSRIYNTDEDGAMTLQGDTVKIWGFDNDKHSSVFCTNMYASASPSIDNLYNYTMIEGMPHGVERHILKTALDYVFQYRRLPDGSLVKTEADNGFIISLD